MSVERRTEFAWAAGLIDGEGSIDVTRHQSRTGCRFYPRLRVHMTSRIAVERLQRIFHTGTVTMRTPKDGIRQRSYCWAVENREDLQRVLRGLMDFLIVKRWQAALASALLNDANALKASDRAAITDEIRRAKRPVCHKEVA